MSAGMTVTPVLAEEATPEAAAPAETVAVDAPTFYANSHDVKAVVMNIGAAQDSVNVTWYGSTPTGGMLKYGVQGGEMTTLQAAVAPHQQRRLVQEYRYPDRPAEQHHL